MTRELTTEPERVAAGELCTARTAKDPHHPWAFSACPECIAPIVAALNAAGIETRTSCCGHGQYAGSIQLADGRILSVSAEGI